MWNVLTADTPARSRYSNRRSAGAVIGLGGGRAADGIERAVGRRGDLIVRRSQRERQRLGAELVLDELLRLFLLIEVVLQPPALEARAAIREHGDDVVGLDADVTLDRIPNHRLGRWSRFGRLRGMGGSRSVTGRGRVGDAASPAASGAARHRLVHRLWKRLRGERLINVEHQEREKDGDEDTALFHFSSFD